MAEFTYTPDDEEVVSQWVEEVEATGEQVMEASDREDQQAQKQEKAKKSQAEEEGVVTRTEYLADKFLDSASEEEKRLFAIYRRGDEDPRQMRAIIELAQTKAAEASKALSAEVEEKAEEKATQIAADQYGVGPITPGQASRKMTPQEEFDALAAQAKAERDTHKSFQLWNALPGSGEITPPD